MEYRCPTCGKEIPQATALCPNCGSAVRWQNLGRTPVWAVLLGVVLLVVAVLIGSFGACLLAFAGAIGDSAGGVAFGLGAIVLALCVGVLGVLALLRKE